MRDASLVTKGSANSGLINLLSSTGSQPVDLSDTHSNDSTLRIWVPVSTPHNLGFVGHWKTSEGLGQWLIEAAGGVVWGGLRIIKRANEELPIWDLGLGLIKGSNIELFSISRT